VPLAENKEFGLLFVWQAHYHSVFLSAGRHCKKSTVNAGSCASNATDFVV
jgi:hypothetical protein